jgi:hypothetical protein
MAIEYTWTVNSMYTLPQVDGFDDVVVVAVFTVSGTDGEYSASLGSNSCQFTISEDQPDFTPYDELTEEQVIGWIQNTLGENGVTSYEASIAGNIESQINPPVTPSQQPLPWAN